MKKIILLLFSTIAMQSQTVTYSESFENFANPERGFHHQIATRASGEASGTYTPLNLAQLINFRDNEGITLISRTFWLDEFMNSEISDSYILKMKTDFATLRSAGMKCIIRFKYTNDETGSETDPIIEPFPDLIYKQIGKLKGATLLNQDVISSVEAGFIGAHGEWTISTRYGSGGDGSLLSAQNRIDRKNIGLKIMELAPTRMVSFRTPYYQQLVAGTNILVNGVVPDVSINTTPISSQNAYNGSVLSRIAAHNDCFLRNSTDGGTFTGNQLNQDTQRLYLKNQSKYTFDGGETCQLYVDPQASTPVPITFLLPSNARDRMKDYHFSYLSTDWFPGVISYWNTLSGIPISNGSFLEETKRNLGYRFVLNQFTLNNDGYSFYMTLKNVGYANVFNPRNAFIILKNIVTGAIYKISMTSTSANDVRTWNAGTTITLSGKLLAPVAQYKVYLEIADFDAPNNPKYSIRFANKFNGVDIWDPITGYNNLNLTITTIGANRIKAGNDTQFYYVNGFPNPFNDTFKFNVNTSSNEILSIKIYDMLGKLIENNNSSISDINNLEIGKNYSKGIYNIVVTQGENIKTLRVIKN